jgi:hypothetical protein
MTNMPNNDEYSDPPGQAPTRQQQTDSFGGGHIKARHGRVNGWLLVVYLALFAWAMYYGFNYWGGLGPGLDLSLGY